VLVAGITAAPVMADTVPSDIPPGAVESSRGIAIELISQLGQKLKGAIASDGPVAAVSVCKETAPAIAKSLSARHGALVSRVGTRARNANMGVPNAWQKDALGDFDARLAKGEKPADLEYWKVVDMGNGQRELRYAKAIVTQQLCVTCHGKAEDIPAPLLEKIRAEYPRDQATGYSVGQLRGAVVVAQPLDPD
jgi:cytochrome c551/c552